MAGTRIFEQKDSDGRWWKFAEQNKAFSCGPTCVKIVKEYTFNRQIGEDAMRGLLGLLDLGLQHTGTTLLQAEIDTAPIWNTEGVVKTVILEALHKEPCRIPHARLTNEVAELRKSSGNHPALLCFHWVGGGGHCVVCVGPTARNQDAFVILDPWFGLHSLSVSQATGNNIRYTAPNGVVGDIDPTGFIVTTPL